MHKRSWIDLDASRASHSGRYPETGPTILCWLFVYMIFAAFLSSCSQETLLTQNRSPVKPDRGSTVNLNYFLEQAAKDATLIRHDGIRPFVLLNIVKAQSEIKDFEAAFETIKLIRNEFTASEALQQVSIKQAEAGDIAAALKTAAKIREEPIHIKKAILAYNQVAEIQAKAGDKNSARNTLEKAIRLANKDVPNAGSKHSLTADNLLTIAAGQIRIDDRGAAIKLLEQAFAVITKIDLEQLKNSFHDPVSQVFDPRLVQIADAYAKAGDIGGALKAVDAIRNQDQKKEALNTIIRAIIGDKKIEEAYLLTTLVSNNPNFERTLRITIMTEQARLGDVKGALKTFDVYYDSYWDPYLFHIVGAQIRAKEFEAAFHTTGKVKENAHVLGMVALAYAEAGDKKRAREILQLAFDKIGARDDGTSPRIPSYALGVLAKAQAKSDDFEGALDTVDRISNHQEKIFKLIDIAQWQVESGDRGGGEITLQRATNIAVSLPKTSSGRSHALIRIGVGQWKAGFKASAKKSLKEALESALAIRNILTRLSVIEKAATAQAEAGDVEAALEAVAEHLPTYIDKGRAIQSIAMVQARQGDVEGVRAWSSSQAPDLRARALLGIAEGLLGHSQ